MKRLIILTDEESEFLISKANLRYFTSMDINAIKGYFTSRNFSVEIYKFSEFDFCGDYRGVAILYQTSEAPGAFYKRYIEDMVYFLEKKEAVMLPRHSLLKAHHDKIFMEFLRNNFAGEALKTVKSWCYGSWVDALNYDHGFPVVIKQASSSGGAGVFLAKDRKQFSRLAKRAGQVIIAGGAISLLINFCKTSIKKMIVYFSPEKGKLVKYDVSPVSTGLVLQTFIPDLKGDFKVLFFGGKYYMMYRRNRKNDFRASGSGSFHPVPENKHNGLLDFARLLTLEIDFPVIGMDIGFDGNNYHLIEYQVIHIGTSALHRSIYWHEFEDGVWVRHDGPSNLEEEFSRSVHGYLREKFPSMFL